MNIGVDLDDVLADFVLEFKTITHNLFRKPADISVEPVDWDWSNYNLTKDEMNKAWEVVHNTHNFWLTLHAEEGVDRNLVKRLSEEHNVFHVTARAHSIGMSVKDQSACWVRLMYDVEYPTVIVNNNKGPLCAALELDYFIDDRPKNCIEIKAAVPNCKVFLKDASHNQDFSHPDIPRISGFNEFAKLILGGENVGSN